VEAYIERGREIEVPRPPCPDCSGPTGAWTGYERHLRADRDWLIWIPRVRCHACEVTHALLPWFAVPHRWDVVDVIGRALEMAAAGQGYRTIARTVGRPETTVRAWCRRFRRQASSVAAVLLERAASWGWSSWELPTSAQPRCVAAVAALAGQWRRRRGPVETWRPANLVTGGRLLASNMRMPLAAGRAWSWMSAKSKQEVPDGP
jgi:hypothetical protein